MLTVVPIAFAKGCLPCVVPSQATALCSHRRAWSKPKRLPGTGPCPTSDGNGLPWSCSGITNHWWPTVRPRHGSRDLCVRCNGGAAAGPRATLRWTTSQDGAARRLCPPRDQALVQALAWALVAATQPPWSRQSLAAVTARARHALGTPSSRSPVWRLRETAAIKPWRYKDGSFPREAHCAETAGPMLDL
jgi:hypothetical protein